MDFNTTEASKSEINSRLMTAYEIVNIRGDTRRIRRVEENDKVYYLLEDKEGTNRTLAIDTILKRLLKKVKSIRRNKKLAELYKVDDDEDLWKD